MSTSGISLFGSISTVRDEGRRDLLRVETFDVCAIFMFISLQVAATRDRICRLPRFNPTRIVSELVSSGMAIALHYTTLHYITLRHITPRASPSHYITRHYITLRCVTLHLVHAHRITLQYTTLQYVTSHFTSGMPIAFHYTTLHYITLRHITPRVSPSHSITLHYITSRHMTPRASPSHSITPHDITLRYIITPRACPSHSITLHVTPSHCVALLHLGHPHQLRGLRGGDRDAERGRVGRADVLRRKVHQPARDVPGVVARLARPSRGVAVECVTVLPIRGGGVERGAPLLHDTPHRLHRGARARGARGSCRPPRARARSVSVHFVPFYAIRRRHPRPPHPPSLWFAQIALYYYCPIFFSLRSRG